jgi:hypothetical protein
MSRITEAEIGIAVLHMLAAQPNGRASVRRIIREMPNYVHLSVDDQEASWTRIGEEIWEQQVRNLKSHSTAAGNIFYLGYIEQYARGVWQITNAGRRRIAKAA